MRQGSFSHSVHESFAAPGRGAVLPSAAPASHVLKAIAWKLLGGSAALPAFYFYYYFFNCVGLLAVGRLHLKAQTLRMSFPSPHSACGELPEAPPLSLPQAGADLEVNPSSSLLAHTNTILLLPGLHFHPCSASSLSQSPRSTSSTSPALPGPVARASLQELSWCPRLPAAGIHHSFQLSEALGGGSV